MGAGGSKSKSKRKSSKKKDKKVKKTKKDKKNKKDKKIKDKNNNTKNMKDPKKKKDKKKKKQKKTRRNPSGNRNQKPLVGGGGRGGVPQVPRPQPPIQGPGANQRLPLNNNPYGRGLDTGARPDGMRPGGLRPSQPGPGLDPRGQQVQGGGLVRPGQPDPQDPIFKPPQNPTFEPSNPQPSARSEQVAPVPERKADNPVGPARLGPDTLKGLVQGTEVTYQRVGRDGRTSHIDPVVNIPVAPVAQPAIVPGTGTVCRDQYGQLMFYEGGVKIGPLAQESNAELRDVNFPTCSGAPSAVPAGGYLPAEPAVNYFCPSPGALCYPERGTVF